MANVVIALGVQEATAAMGKVIKDPVKARENQIAILTARIAADTKELNNLIAQKEKGSGNDIISILKSLKVRVTKAESLNDMEISNHHKFVAKIDVGIKKAAGFEFAYVALARFGKTTTISVIEQRKEVRVGRTTSTSTEYYVAKDFPIKANTVTSVRAALNAATKFAAKAAKSEISTRRRAMK